MIFEKYLKEIHSQEVMRTQYGFVVYQVQENSLFISELFIEKDFRKNRHGKMLIEIMEQEARKCEKPYLTGFVGKHNNTEGVLALAFFNDWKVSSFSDRGIFIQKEVKKRG